MELAHWFSQRAKTYARHLVSDLRRRGARACWDRVTTPIIRSCRSTSAVAMINMDMIGRIRDRKVYVGGVGTGTTFADLLKDVGPRHDFETDVTERAGYGSSDHTSFTAKQVPVLFFFSGLHADYHKPSDTWDKIDAPAAVRLLDLVADVMDHLRDAPAATPIRARGRAATATPMSPRRIRQSIRIRARFRQHPGFHRASQRRPFRRYPARIARGQGGPSGRRHPHRIRRQAHPEPVRFHVRATGQTAWPGSTCKGTTRGPNN